MRPRILVVEDDHALRDVLRRGLSDEDFEPVLAADGATALRLATGGIAAAVLDIGLPDADGRDVCQAMRANGFAAPVIFLTARHQLTDRLSGFAAGGDVYLPKPFHLVELAAVLRAVLKRAVATPAVPAGGLVLDAVDHSVTVHGVRSTLSPTEFRLLATLVAADGTLVRRRDLVRAGWPDGAQVSDNTVDQYLSRLRRKLREAGSSLTISTARGVGHRLS
ncbi:DNA-binding response regulator [Streptomyces olivaceoviridis]|uniref:response regulator transcription factor n=1 Tax=Streptomyces olivaceoviridis TaxID=1921 RepID=UPI001678F96E|nr:response regulator transcription factor [Streptomyces olivaceoviridis]GGY97155.1 DNA-binding response regulator [Streptomyces olivaceoviridis]